MSDNPVLPPAPTTDDKVASLESEVGLLNQAMPALDEKILSHDKIIDHIYNQLRQRNLISDLPA